MSVRKTAREELGLHKLRPGQAEAIEQVAVGRDVLAVMPTGYGKSAIYQVAALERPGPTIVVSPLVALQRDQVEDLEEHGAIAFNSALSDGRREDALEDVAVGELEFLFCAPEQFGSEGVLARLAAAKPSLLVVDEAHCISEWGHDFRPDYLLLGAVAEALGRPPILALTATAAPPVRAEIVERLRMQDPYVVVQGFDRPNIHLAVERHGSEQAKRDALAAFVAGRRGDGIVYTATRKRAEELAELLGEGAMAYHAGLRKSERDAVHEAFMDGDLRVVVATIAFGMGIDKPDVRFVVHHDISDSLDSYQQEIGRAGRDGEPAEALLLYRPEDLGLRRFFAGSGQVDADQVAQVAEAVGKQRDPVDPSELRDQLDISKTRLMAAVHRLEELGVVEVDAQGLVSGGGHVDEVAEQAAAAQERRRDMDRTRIEMMRGYAEAGGCRREFLLSYFGEAYEPPCGHCDVCDAGGGEAADVDTPFAVGARVAHARFGAGAVQRIEDDKLVVLFDEGGYRAIALELAGDVLELGVAE